MPCSICQHGKRQAIVEAMMHDSVRTVAERYGVGKSTLARHLSQCPSTVPAAPQAVPTVPKGQTTAPAFLVNAPVHAEVLRLAAVLNRESYMVDTLHALRSVVALLLKMVQDEPDTRQH